MVTIEKQQAVDACALRNTVIEVVYRALDDEPRAVEILPKRTYRTIVMGGWK